MQKINVVTAPIVSLAIAPASAIAAEFRVETQVAFISGSREARNLNSKAVSKIALVAKTIAAADGAVSDCPVAAISFQISYEP